MESFGDGSISIFFLTGLLRSRFMEAFYFKIASVLLCALCAYVVNYTMETQSSWRYTENFDYLSNPINPPKSWFRLFFIHVCFHSSIIEYQIAKCFYSHI